MLLSKILYKMLLLVLLLPATALAAKVPPYRSEERRVG